MMGSRRLSNTAVDRLGVSLRNGCVSDSEILLLENYREAYDRACQQVRSRISIDLELESTARPAKTTQSIVAKLQREPTIRLFQIQDIAGCRLVVGDVSAQEAVLRNLSAVFPDASIVDRRGVPSHSYRAVHVIPRIDGCLVEIQLRTYQQHRWAELSEKFADAVDPSVKYGGGPPQLRSELDQFAKMVAQAESLEEMLLSAGASHADVLERLTSVRSAIESKYKHLIAYFDLKMQG